MTPEAIRARAMPLDLRSPAFERGAFLPERFTLDGANVPPPLAWSGAPAQTRSFALVVEDLDTPQRPFVHWLAWNIDGEARALAEGVASGAPGLVQGTNDYGRLGWGGPCPPRGKGAHRYRFRILALDILLDLPAGAGREKLEGHIHGHALAVGELSAKYAWRDR